MTRPPCCLERTSFHHGLPAYNLDLPCKNMPLYTSMEKVKLLSKKPDKKQEDVEKIILFWPQCTMWVRDLRDGRRLIFPHPILSHTQPVWLAQNVCEK